MQQVNSPALRALAGPAGDLWRDEAVRLQRVVELHTAHEAAQHPGAGQAERDRAQRLAETFTEDVRAGMQALGWDLAAVQQHPITVQIGGTRAHGLALPPREIRISETLLAEAGRTINTDSLMRTWVQELVHVRHVISDNYWLELDRFTGFEEGLAEGVARLAVIREAGMHPHLIAYSHYAYTYRNLASVLNVAPEELFSRLWSATMGRVREWFPEVVVGILEETGNSTLSEEQTTRLRLTADDLFCAGRSYAAVNEPALRAAWSEALR